MYIPPHWGIFLVLIVSFLVFWFIFNRLFFGPFLKVLGEREGRLKDLAERTARLTEQAQAADERRGRELEQVRREAMARREEQRHKAEAEAAEAIERARAQTRADLDRVREGIERDVTAAERQLEDFAKSLAVEVAERVLGRSLDGTADRTNN